MVHFEHERAHNFTNSSQDRGVVIFGGCEISTIGAS